MKGSSRKKRSAPARGSRTAGQRQPSKPVVLGALVLLALAVVGLALWLPSSSNRAAGEAASSDKSKGAATAQVVVEEYADFQCPACRRFFEGPARQLEEEYVNKGQVRFVFRHYAFLGQESRWAAEATECANEQGRFWDYYERLFNEQGGENVGVFSKQNLQRIAGELGLDMGSFSQCLQSGKYAEKVLQDINAGSSKGVRGTPTLFVNGQRIDGGSNYAVLREAIEAALSAGAAAKP